MLNVFTAFSPPNIISHLCNALVVSQPCCQFTACVLGEVHAEAEEIGEHRANNSTQDNRVLELRKMNLKLDWCKNKDS